MSFELKIFKHLLPRARAWNMTLNKRLREFFQGLTTLPADFREYVDLLWLDLFPETTRELVAWEKQFGLPDTGSTMAEADRRARLDGAWKARGGQDPAYIEDTIRAAGFDVYLHEWWVPGSDPAVARNPFTYMPTYLPLVNKVQQADRNWTMLCGEPLAECGEPAALCGEYDGIKFWYKEYEIVNSPALYPYYIYFGGATFPNTANVDASRRDEFENLLLKLCPMEQYILPLVVYV